VGDSPTPVATSDVAAGPSRGPSLVRSALVGTLLTLSMLYLDWVAAPIVERLIVGQHADTGPFLTPHTAAYRPRFHFCGGSGIDPWMGLGRPSITR
jgi:hypothetical protein